MSDYREKKKKPCLYHLGKKHGIDKNLKALELKSQLEKYGKFPKISNTLFHPFFGLNFAFYAVVSLNT